MMTPERATKILNTESKVMPGFKLIEVGSVRAIMGADEIYQVNTVWNNMNGNTSFRDALLNISRSVMH